MIAHGIDKEEDADDVDEEMLHAEVVGKFEQATEAAGPFGVAGEVEYHHQAKADEDGAGQAAPGDDHHPAASAGIGTAYKPRQNSYDVDESQKEHVLNAQRLEDEHQRNTDDQRTDLKAEHVYEEERTDVGNEQPGEAAEDTADGGDSGVVCCYRRHHADGEGKATEEADDREQRLKIAISKQRQWRPHAKREEGVQDPVDIHKTNLLCLSCEQRNIPLLRHQATIAAQACKFTEARDRVDYCMRLVLILLFPFTLVAQQAYIPTADYERRDIHGWAVYLSPQLLADELSEATTTELGVQLYRIQRRLPPAAVRELRKVPIWMELDAPKPLCMAYHPQGTEWLALHSMNPDKQGAVDCGSARRFVEWTQQQPWMLLHELAHAFHDRLPQGFENPEVLAAFDAAKNAGLYEHVLRWSGRDERAYALNNQMEYFAEITEAYFAHNDYFPFVRAELARYDPQGLKLMKTLWGVADSDNYLWQVPSLPASTPWDLTALSKPPKIEWLKRDGPVRSLLYPGEPFDGKPTRVFAYYATPGTLAGDPTLDVGLPGVVLVHGGGGTAFAEWVTLWAKRGYAALAMDLAGKGADRKRLPDGGPDQSHIQKFEWIDRDVTEQWQYHAVANVIRGHTLLRARPEVQASRTAITGISWGGYLTCIVAGLDKRFAAAVPVYGCGFLTEGSAWDKEFRKMNEEQLARWVELWEPSRYLGSAAMPVFFVNGTNDFAYWLPSYGKTAQLVPNRTMRIEVRMKHGHEAGWAPAEIGRFVDSIVKDGPPLLTFGSPTIANGKMSLEVLGDQAIASASLHFTTGDGPPKERIWESAPAVIEGRRIVADLPKGATIWYLSATDQAKAMVSGDLMFAEP